MYRNETGRTTTFFTCTRPPAHAPLAIALAVALGLAPLVASAAVITVTSTADPGTVGTCSLRQAITSMNNAAATGDCTASGSFGSNDTIVFDTGAFPDGSPNVITLAGSQLDITADRLIIDATANGLVVIDADQASRVMLDSAATGAALTLTHLELRNGHVTGLGGGGIRIPDADLTLAYSTVSGNFATNEAGGIYARDGSVTLSGSTVSGNSTYSIGGGAGGISGGVGGVTLINSTVSGNAALLFLAGGVGGGIFDVNGDVTLINSTVSGNTAQDGGGIFFTNPSGSITLTNSTVSGNSATEQGGGINSDADLTATNSTVSGNSADLGGGIYFDADIDVAARNMIVAGNDQTSGGDINGATVSGSSNLIGGDPLLGALADNGGHTQTMMPQVGSPAIDTGVCHDANASPPDGIPTSDQRGVPRPLGGNCEIGAVEAVPVNGLIAVFGSGQTTIIWHEFSNPLTVQVLGPMDRPAPYVEVQAIPAVAGQPGATCTDAITNGAGNAYLYCRSNGIAGPYDVEVRAVGWPGVPPVTFALTNINDGDTIFLNGFEPPGP